MAHKPNIKDLEMGSDDEGSQEDGDMDDIYDDEDDDAEEGESDIDDDMGASGSEASDVPKKGRLVDSKSGDVYKAPKLNAVAYEDSKDKKKRLKEEYQRKRLGKTGLVDELKHELDDAPEEVYMGGVAKKGKVAKYQDALEREELEAFRRVNMTNKEKRALRNKNLEEMQDRLENLDDDFAAIQSIVKRTGQRGNDEIVESAERDAASSKFSKSLK